MWSPVNTRAVRKPTTGKKCVLDAFGESILKWHVAAAPQPRKKENNKKTRKCTAVHLVVDWCNRYPFEKNSNKQRRFRCSIVYSNLFLAFNHLSTLLNNIWFNIFSDVFAMLNVLFHFGSFTAAGTFILAARFYPEVLEKRLKMNAIYSLVLLLLHKCVHLSWRISIHT